ncbi:MAG: hypothetical protein HOC77_14355 [Chloroflexi bacterium]|jgi:hypothetical protein|nr:hypothetical protein [Chloroflexota bacterium]
MARDPVTIDDLIISGAAAHTVLAQITASGWSDRPPNMEWTRLVTVTHICSALLFYATQLAVGSGKHEETIRPDESTMTGEKLPELLISQCKLLAAVAKGSPPNTRGFHPVGQPDAEGFLAMGCTEILLHTWDAMAGTGIEFKGDDGVADRVLRRLLPWAPTETPRWQTFLFATGRGELPGYESPGDRWMWHNDPLEEWDGHEKRSDHWVGRV